jgi:exodeoxyribonuclease-3
MKVVTWNVNSIRQREGHVARWLEREQPDLLFLQEIKCESHAFPAAAFEALGYRAEVVGQKTYNGVAVLARTPFEVTHRALPGLDPEDAQSRYIGRGDADRHLPAQRQFRR